ncbi:MAG: hypothetical protein KC493_00755 [Bacteriovoracaceae bacterium]|nr:hypothetical protein [Bacteriovoracaceae bacterium]
MKFVGCLFLWIVFSSSSFAYEVPSYFLKRWTATPVKVKKEKGKTIARSKVFRRYAMVGGKVFSIGTVTFFQVKKKKTDKLTAETFLSLKSAYGEDERWTTKKIGKTMVVEGPWKKGNRYFRFYITELKESLSISTASFRLGYQDSVGPESLIIQRGMAETANKKRHFSIFNFVSPISEAQAQFGGWPFGGGSGTGSGGNPLDFSDLTTSVDQLNNNFGQINNQLTQTNTQLGNANNNWNNTNTELGNANNNWNNTNTQIGNANQNWNNTNTQIGNANTNWNNSNQNWANSNTQMANANQNWAETNRQYARTNDIAEKMLDPKHMFTLAAATSAGAVFGATLANLVIDGVVAGAKAIWNLITDAKNKAERWEKFKKARKGWEKMNQAVRKLESLLDNFLMSQELMQKIQESIRPEDKHKLSRESLISHLSISHRRLKKRKTLLEDIFDSTTDMRCEEIVAKKLDEVEKLMTNASNLKKFLNLQQFEVYNDKMFCDKLQGIMGKLGEAEAALQSYRINILNAREEWEEHNEDRIEDMADAIERINDEDTAEDFMDQRIENAEELFETLEDGLEDHEDNWVDNCKTSHPDWNKRFNSHRNGSNNFARSRNRRKIRKACEVKYKAEFGQRNAKRLSDAKIAMNKKITLAKRDFQRSRNTPIEIDTSVEDGRLLSYYKWFSDIEEQQHCYTHREKDKCKRAGKVKFMGPFYVLDRAKARLQNICGHDQYTY